MPGSAPSSRRLATIPVKICWKSAGWLDAISSLSSTRAAAMPRAFAIVATAFSRLVLPIPLGPVIARFLKSGGSPTASANV